MDRQTDRKTDGKMDGRTDGWTDGTISRWASWAKKEEEEQMNVVLFVVEN
jgi:hypothetical protein